MVTKYFLYSQKKAVKLLLKIGILQLLIINYELGTTTLFKAIWRY